MNEKLKCVAIADTHGMYRDIKLPDGDVLIHAGDITMRGKLSELCDFNNWLGEQPHKHKIIIAGNHDWCFERQKEASIKLITNAVYLEDKFIEIEGHKFYGSPWQPWFLDWAFNLQRGEEIQKKWDLISNDVDVLITHGPAFGILDKVARANVGCENLLSKIEEIKPKVHVCGHIHEGYGEVIIEGVKFINASINTEHYKPINTPISFLLD